MSMRGVLFFIEDIKLITGFLNGEEVIKLLDVIVDYIELGREPSEDDKSRVALMFGFLRQKIDREQAKYEKRIEDARKGGRKSAQMRLNASEFEDLTSKLGSQPQSSAVEYSQPQSSAVEYSQPQSSAVEYSQPYEYESEYETETPVLSKVKPKRKKEHPANGGILGATNIPITTEFSFPSQLTNDRNGATLVEVFRMGVPYGISITNAQHFYKLMEAVNWKISSGESWQEYYLKWAEERGAITRKPKQETTATQKNTRKIISDENKHGKQRRKLAHIRGGVVFRPGRRGYQLRAYSCKLEAVTE